MKTQNIVLFFGALLAVYFSLSCKKKSNEPLGPNDLGGEWDIELTKVGRESDLLFEINGSNSAQGSVTVVSNEKGIVTYRFRVNLNGSPDSAWISALLPPHYFVEPGIIERYVKLKITSEGIQDFFWDNKKERPWTIVKYNDGVGTTYPYTTSKGAELNRVITEKTGIDEWPFGFYYIKTTKIEQTMLPPEDEYVKKIIYRANHKFGLVYTEVELTNGQKISMSIYPWFLM